MSFTVRRLVLSYAIAAGGVVLAGLSHWWLAPWIADSPPVRLLLVVVVMASAWIGGLGPGLFATVLGLMVIVAANDAPADIASLVSRLIRFGSLALLITVLFTGLHAYRQRAEDRERAFRRSEVRYRQLVETAGEGIWTFDASGLTTYANPRLGEMLGVPPEELLGRRLEDFLAEPDEQHQTWLTLASGVPEGHEVRLRGKDDEVRIAVVTARSIGPDEIPGPAADQNTAGGGLLLLVTDVTELRRAFSSLREKESVLRSFYESSALAMGVIEQTACDARIVSANALAEKFFGVAPGELEGKTANELRISPEMMAVWLERFHECRASGRPVRFEYQADCSSSPEWVAATLSPMGAPAAEPALCSFIVEDITKRKRNERELREAKELAEAASQAKDRFLAILSHELRTPLTPALFGVSSLLESKPSASMLPTLEMIHRNIELEARLIDDLLDLSRLARGKLRLDLETVDIHEAIRRAIEICRDETLVAGLNVVAQLDAANHHVPADHARVMQIAWNLIHNAAKFTPPGGLLTIRTVNPAQPSGAALQEPGRVAVEFEDTGVGIDTAELPRIFESFEQGQEGPRGKSGGLGVGLAISRALAEALGGRLTASSRGRGLGSTFRLELTTVPAAPSPAGESSERIPAAPARRTNLPGLRILLVEDNRDTLRFLAAVLRQRGHDVVAAESVAAARAAAGAAGTPFDLLLSDIELPDGDGLYLMRELAASTRLVGIALSGFGTEEDVRQSRAAGFLDHLTKPVDLNRLEAAIWRAEAVITPPGRSSASAGRIASAQEQAAGSGH
jgi:PAS domain S-box-containing protein